jgi:hypothetical protein
LGADKSATLRRALAKVRERISLVQQGVISQNEFAKFLMLGSRGLIELAAPLTDEERRDFEVRIRGLYGSALAMQVKSAMQLANLGGKACYLRINFSVRNGRVVNDPLFWYFFAFLDLQTMGFADPTFLIPSRVFHQHANSGQKGGFWHFTLEASMEAGSHDRWTPYRVNARNLGQKLMSIIREQKEILRVSPEAARLIHIPELVWARAA